MKIKYKKYGDYLLPNLALNGSKNKFIGKYGIIVLKHIKRHRKALYQNLLMNNTLNSFLYNINKILQQDINNLIQKIIENENIDEELKNKDPLKWIGLMNNIKLTAEEMVINTALKNL